MASQWLGLRLLGLGLLLTALALTGELSFVLLYSNFAVAKLPCAFAWTSSWYENGRGYVRGANLWHECGGSVGKFLSYYS